MARTSIPTGHPLSPVIVHKLLFLDQLKEAYFSRFMSAGGDAPVYEKTDFTKQRGDTMTFGLRLRLKGNPVQGSTTMKGKEDKLDFHNFQMVLDRFRYAVMDDGKLSNQRPVMDIPAESRQALVDWGAEFIDQLAFDRLSVDPANAASTIFGGGAANLGALAAGNVITPAQISEMKVRALTQRDGGRIPIRPIRVDGKDHLLLLVSPDVTFDLKRNSEFQQAQREAMPRGSDNPLFTGMVGMWDNVVIHEHENIYVRSDGGGGAVPYSRNLLLGAQSLCWAWGERPSIVEEMDDYEEFTGWCWRMTAEAKKPVFNGEDYGSLQFICADTRRTQRVTNIR